MNNNLSLERLRQVLSYDPVTGAFVWLEKPNRRIVIGSFAGANARGYTAIRIDKVTYFAHRLAWFYVHGVWPINEIDHIDGVKSNNRVSNLRGVDRSGNMQNRKGADCDSKTGLLGVSPHRKRFLAQISIARKHYYLGTFPTAQAAHSAYLTAKSGASA